MAAILLAPSIDASRASRTARYASGAPICAMIRAGPRTSMAVSMRTSRSSSFRAGNSPVVPATSSPSTRSARNSYRRRAQARSTEPSAANGVGTAARTTSATRETSGKTSAGLGFRGLSLEVGRRGGTPEIEDRHRADHPQGQDQDQRHDQGPGDGHAAVQLTEHAVGVQGPEGKERRGGDPRPAAARLVRPRHPQPQADRDQPDHDRVDDEAGGGAADLARRDLVVRK